MHITSVIQLDMVVLDLSKQATNPTPQEHTSKFDSLSLVSKLQIKFLVQSTSPIIIQGTVLHNDSLLIKDKF
jgi:hypothetical protein